MKDCEASIPVRETSRRENESSTEETALFTRSLVKRIFTVHEPLAASRSNLPAQPVLPRQTKRCNEGCRSRPRTRSRHVRRGNRRVELALGQRESSRFFAVVSGRGDNRYGLWALKRIR